MICYLCRRDVPEEKMTSRRCTNRKSCFRRMASQMGGLVYGTYKHGPHKGQPRVFVRRR